MADADFQEPILTENRSRHVLFPIVHEDLFKLYKQASSSYWVAEELNFDQDLADLEKLTENERYFVTHVLSFFSSSDGIVMENLANRFSREVMLPEARAFYAFQIAIEAVHSEVYSLLIDTYERDPIRKQMLFEAVNNFPAIKEKADWGLRWIEDNESSFAQRLVAFAIVEGLFFSGSFCAIFWLRERGLLKGLSHGNQMISKDENLHTTFACTLYKKLLRPLEKEKVYEMMEEAIEIEKRFITESLPCAMIGMNSDLMKEYIHFVADLLLTMLGYPKLYNAKNPFPFMEASAYTSIGSFFEVRISEYAKPVNMNGGSLIPDKLEVCPEDDDF